MYHGNLEPTVSELLGDPIARLVLARDGLHVDAVWDCLHDAKRRLRSVPPLLTQASHRRWRGVADRRRVAAPGAPR